jgi:psp operon transcriptional activator
LDALTPIPGEDPVFLDAIEHLGRVASVERPCLVVGERGTGKELFATRLHYLSPRWDQEILKVNCAALTDSLLESELFGHEAGAFTGATRRHAGCFERAHGGTLVLDEIASASLAVQEKLLRVIEYGEIQRVGGSDTLEVDVRVVGASNVDLPSLARRGEFRADLLDRLAFDVVTIPPLRARPADVLPLAEGFAIEMTRALRREVFVGFSADVTARLLAYQWPGNVRELKNVVERSVYQSSAELPIELAVFDPFDSPWRPPGDLSGSPALDAALTAATPQAEPPGSEAYEHVLSEGTPCAYDETRSDESSGGLGFADAVARFERARLNEALVATHHHQRKAADELGLGYHQFRRLLSKYKLLPAAKERGATQAGDAQGS